MKSEIRAIRLIDKSLDSLKAQLAQLEEKMGVDTMIRSVIVDPDKWIGRFYSIAQEEPPVDNIEGLIENIKKDISFLSQIKIDFETKYKVTSQDYWKEAYQDSIKN